MTRIRFSRKKYASSYEIPDYENMQKLVERMRVKLDKKHPFVLKRRLNNAFSDPLMMRVILGAALVNRLESQERMALVSHELTHLKKEHVIKQLLLLLSLYVPLAFTLRREPDFIFGAVWMALFLTLFPYVSRRFEYEADAGAAAETSPEASISLLKKLKAEERWGREAVTHPSILSRVERLRKRQR